MTTKSGMLMVVLLAWISLASYVFTEKIHANDISEQSAANPTAESTMVDSLLTASSNEVLNVIEQSIEAIAATTAEEIVEETVTLSSKDATFYFDFAEEYTTITDEELAYFDELAAYLKQNSEEKLLLEGHADNRGSYKANVTFRKKRVMFIAENLDSRGVDRHQVVVKYYGANRPAADNNTEDGRMQNRRVNLKLVEGGAL